MCQKTNVAFMCTSNLSLHVFSQFHQLGDTSGLDDFGRGNITGEQSGRCNVTILGDDHIIDIFSFC
jgi:hypothetical protein